MTIQIVKDDNFKTVGFHVISEQETIYRWGVAAINTFYFVKEIRSDKWETQIAKIIRLHTQMEMLSSFSDNFFRIGMESKALVDGKGVNFKSIDDRIDKLDTEIKSIISSII